MPNDCIFCGIVEGRIAAEKVYEDSEILAFDDIKPSALVHVLIIPKKHVANLFEEKNAELLGKLQLAACKIAGDLGVEEAFKLTTNNGKGAGQEIMHLHYHLMAGFKK